MGLRLNVDKIMEHQKDFEDYSGLLPIILMTYIHNWKYIDNLKKKNLYYGNVQRKQWERREKIRYLTDTELIQFTENELEKWIKKNNYTEVLQ